MDSLYSALPIFFGPLLYTSSAGWALGSRNVCIWAGCCLGGVLELMFSLYLALSFSYFSFGLVRSLSSPSGGSANLVCAVWSRPCMNQRERISINRSNFRARASHSVYLCNKRRHIGGLDHDLCTVTPCPLTFSNNSCGSALFSAFGSAGFVKSLLASSSTCTPKATLRLRLLALSSPLDYQIDLVAGEAMRPLAR